MLSKLGYFPLGVVLGDMQIPVCLIFLFLLDDYLMLRSEESKFFLEIDPRFGEVSLSATDSLKDSLSFFGLD